MQYFPPSNLDDFTKNIQAAVAIEQCQIAFGYIGWTPNYVLGSNLSVDNYTLYSLPFVLSQNNTSYSLQDAPLCPFPTCHNGPNTPATFYAAVFASMAGTASYNFETCDERPKSNPEPEITFFQCEQLSRCLGVKNMERLLKEGMRSRNQQLCQTINNWTPPVN